MKIAVIGLGYVGLANALLLAQSEEVIAYDIDSNKINKLNKGISPIEDDDIKEYLSHKRVPIFTNSLDEIFTSELFIISTPTNFDESTGYFDTSSVDKVIDEIYKSKENASIIIKSTIPIGYTENKRQQYDTDKIIFIPEFLREGKALYDNLYPSRIVIGGANDNGQQLAKLFLKNAKKSEVPIVITHSTEAEAIKLFSNTYLAMRISYFNELDTYAKMHNLSSRDIINGVCADPRIGTQYNNPSFGYGGYCLPKDTKQLLANFKGVPNSIIESIVTSNEIRKSFIIDDIKQTLSGDTIGIYRLTMKANSDNFRFSAVQDIIKSLQQEYTVIIYEPSLLSKNEYMNCQVINKLEDFIEKSDLIIANRVDHILESLNLDNIYSRDLFNIN